MKKRLTLLLVLAMLTGLMPLKAHAEEPLASSGLTLDSVAWESLTYRDIFVDYNLVYLNGFDNNSWGSFIQNTGKNVITSAACHSTPYSLKAAGTSSQQIKSESFYYPGDYFLASKVYCTRYVKGKLGVCIGSQTIGASSVTNGFVTQAGIVTNGDYNNIFIGSIHSANLDGYVDDPVVVRMSIFKTRPTAQQLTALYEQYLGIKMTSGSAPSDPPPTVYSDRQKLDAFVDYMQEKAEAIGMTNSVFGDPLGTYANTTTPNDMMKLLVYAYSNPQVREIWSMSSKQLTITGSNPRQKTVNFTIMKPALLNYYKILGGKTGTLDCCINLGVILEIPGSADRLAVLVMGANASDSNAGNRYQAAKEVADAAMIKYRSPGTDVSGTKVSSASALAWLLPADGSAPKVLFSKAPDRSCHPASMTKMLTAVSALDYIRDMDATVTYKQFDIDTCPWYYYDFYAGDVMSVRDTFCALLLPSSNVTAYALARYAGGELLTHTHSYTAAVTAPTCTTGGYTTYTCYCGDSYVGSYTDPKGHSYKAVVTAPTCTAGGYTTYTCGCGDSYVGAYTDPKGHSYKAVVTAPTCTTGGYTTYTCGCGDSYVDSYTNPKGHSYKAVVTAPTCTARGYTTYTCGCGNSYVDAYTDPTGHSWGEWTVVKEPTTTQTGLQKRNCTSCGAEEEGVIPVIPIRYGDVNGDGTVNSQDMLLLRQYVAGWDVTLDLEAADVNANGIVNVQDMLLLRQYVAGWDVTLG